jgi:hypothetical protein
VKTARRGSHGHLITGEPLEFYVGFALAFGIISGAVTMTT